MKFLKEDKKLPGEFYDSVGREVEKGNREGEWNGTHWAVSIFVNNDYLDDLALDKYILRRLYEAIGQDISATKNKEGELEHDDIAVTFFVEWTITTGEEESKYTEEKAKKFIVDYLKKEFENYTDFEVNFLAEYLYTLPLLSRAKQNGFTWQGFLMNEIDYYGDAFEFIYPEHKEYNILLDEYEDNGFDYQDVDGVDGTVRLDAVKENEDGEYVFLIERYW